MFTITLSELENQYVATIRWADYKHIDNETMPVDNTDAFRAYVLSKIPTILKNIINRFAKHRLKELQNTELYPKAKDFHTYCKELSRQKSIGNVCEFIKKQSHRIKSIKPDNGGWADVMDEVINYASEYVPLSVDKQLKSIINQKINTHE